MLNDNAVLEWELSSQFDGIPEEELGQFFMAFRPQANRSNTQIGADQYIREVAFTLFDFNNQHSHIDDFAFNRFPINIAGVEGIFNIVVNDTMANAMDEWPMDEDLARFAARGFTHVHYCTFLTGDTEWMFYAAPAWPRPVEQETNQYPGNEVYYMDPNINKKI